MPLNEQDAGVGSYHGGVVITNHDATYNDDDITKENNNMKNKKKIYINNYNINKNINYYYQSMNNFKKKNNNLWYNGLFIEGKRNIEKRPEEGMLESKCRYQGNMLGVRVRNVTCVKRCDDDSDEDGGVDGLDIEDFLSDKKENFESDNWKDFVSTIPKNSTKGADEMCDEESRPKRKELCLLKCADSCVFKYDFFNVNIAAEYGHLSKNEKLERINLKSNTSMARKGSNKKKVKRPAPSLQGFMTTCNISISTRSLNSHLFQRD